VSVQEKLTQAFARGIADAVGLPFEQVLPLVKPAEPAHGDVSFPTFALAKTLRKAPPAIAAELAGKLQVAGMQVAAAGPYVNARFEMAAFIAAVVDEVRSQPERYASGRQGEGKTVVIDYSSPNIAKPIGFHHIRTTVLGHALANIHRHLGFRVEGINYLGDWGKQFGLVAVGFEVFGDASRRQEMAHLVEVYVKANARAETDPTFDARAKDFFRRMEMGDQEALGLWNDFRQASLAGFEPLYARLGIRFEHIEGESRYEGRMEQVIEEIARTIGVRESEGALVVDLPYAENEPPILLKKTDGSTLYITRDLAAAEDRWKRFHFEQSLYVVARDQAFHFAQLFRVLKAMGKPWADRCLHVAFGRIAGMSTRKGEVVLLTDVLDEARDRALEKVRGNQAEGRIHTNDVETLAEQVGLGAVLFGDLKNRRNSDYTFDWDEVLSFEGHTGPYLQYAHARACSLLSRGGGVPGDVDTSALTLPEEEALVRSVALLPRAVHGAADAYEPSFIASHLLEVAAAFSRWYTLGNQDRSKRVLTEDDSRTRAARLALTDAVRITLRVGLSLLGIPTPENM
jgi:arginyl-tRNA synthetase